jgi:hypothetical protein
MTQPTPEPRNDSQPTSGDSLTGHSEVPACRGPVGEPYAAAIALTGTRLAGGTGERKPREANVWSIYDACRPTGRSIRCR